MSRVCFTVLGSSAGMAQAMRFNAGYLIDIDSRLYLFDCGGGVSSSFCKSGSDPSAVEAILISHAHPDHISDLPLFVQMLYLAGRRERLTVYLPDELIGPISDYFRAVYLLPEKLPFKLDFVSIRAGKSITCGDLEVLPIANKHLAKYEAIIHELDISNRMECFSYLIKAAGKSILYSADLGSEKDIDRYLSNIDLLVVESTHINISALFEAAINNNVGQVVLSHIDIDFDINEAKTLASKAGLENLTIASDGLKIEL